MKYALVSDIHANAQAWAAVLEDIAAQKADAVLCLGDVVGYGPEPVAVLQSVTARAQVILLGNHDAALCGMMGDELFNETARGIIRWTRDQLPAETVKAVRSWPLVVEGDGFSAAHGEFTHPEQFHYIENPEDAVGSWRTAKAPLLFVGHTHTPGVFVLAQGRIPRRLPPQDFTVEPGRRHLVNLGSVSQARDGDPRSSYCLYDTKTKRVAFRRIAFDYEAHRRACEAANLPPLMTGFLTPDPRRDASGRPKIVFFRPAEDRTSAAHGAVHVRQTSDEHARRGRRNVSMAVSLVSLAALAATALLLKHRTVHSPAVVEPVWTSDIRAADFRPGRNVLPRLPEPTEPGEPIAGWTVEAGDVAAQTVAVTALPDGVRAFVLDSSAPDKDFAVVSPLLRVDRNTRIELEARFRPAPGFEGAVKLGLSGRRTPGGPEETLIAREPPAEAEGGWRTARIKLNLQSEIHDLHLQIAGRFRGRVEVSGIGFMRSEETIEELRTAAAPADPTKAWTFNRQLKVEGRTPVLAAKSLGHDPQMETRDLPDGFKGPHLVELRMKSSASGGGHIFWGTPRDPSFTTRRASNLRPTHDGAWHDYAVALRSDGVMAALRIDPAGGSGAIAFERIAVKDAAGRLVREWRFGGAPATNDAASARRAKWTITADSFEPGEGLPQHAFDGRPETFWHTRWATNPPPPPHWIAVDFGEALAISAVTYLPRQDQANGRAKNYEIATGDDGAHWNAPSAHGAFPEGAALQTVKLDPPVRARHLRFTVLDEQAGQVFASAAEIDVVESK